MITIYTWTGDHIRALRDAMHMSIDAFAARIDVAARTVRLWEAQGPDASLRPSSKQLLDTALAEADECVVARFERAIGTDPDARYEVDRGLPATVTLANDTHGHFLTTTLGAVQSDQVWVAARTADGEVVLVPIPRRSVVTGIAVGTLAAAVGIKPVPALAHTPAIDHVEHFRALRMTLIDSDNLYGARAVIPLMEHSLDTMTQLRHAGLGDTAGLLRMQVLYADLAAWLHQDGHTWDRAQYWTDRALEWSHQLNDPYYIAATLIRKCQIAADKGNPQDALELADSARRAAPPETRFAAVASVYGGYAAAAAGNGAASARAFDNSRALAGIAVDDPSWGLFLDDSYIGVHEAHARTAIGDYRAAIDQFGSAIKAMRSGFTRDQAVYVARQAHAHALAGQAEPAAQLGLAAMKVGVSTGSERILHTVRAVNTLLDPRGTESEVAEFRNSGRLWGIFH